MRHRIFLVEDHPVVREAYTSVLAAHDDLELCGAAESAEEALEALRDTPCDLVVTDVRLPGMDGIEFVERLRAMRPGLGAVVITGHEEAAFERRALAAGAVGFLPKRRAARDLVATILAALTSGDLA